MPHQRAPLRLDDHPHRPRPLPGHRPTHPRSRRPRLPEHQL